MFVRLAAALTLIGLFLACSEDGGGESRDRDITRPPPAKRWARVFSEPLPGALISVWGTGSDDVWAVGSAAEDMPGALVLHYDGHGWTRHVLGLEVNLWWVNGSGGGPVYFGGSSGTLLRYDEGTFEKLSTPHERGTVYGVWRAGPGDVWAVGGDSERGSGPFVWRYDGEQVRSAAIPGSDEVALFYKVWGSSADDVWIVGTHGTLLHYDGDGFSRIETGARDPLFTVHARKGARPAAVAVGGSDLVKAFEINARGQARLATFPAGTRQLFGVWIGNETTYAVGVDAAVFRRGADTWEAIDTGLDIHEALHAVWVDPSGGVWAVGGDVLVPPLGNGILVHYGSAVADDVEVEHTPLRQSDAGAARDGGPKNDRDAAPDAPAPRGDGGDASPDSGDSGAAPLPGREPGRVACGETSCDASSEQCCVFYDGEEPAQCVARSDACPVGAFNVDCDEAGDCGPGEQCCLYRFLQGGGIAELSCTASCPGQLVCGASAECGPEEMCTRLDQLPDYPACQ